MWTTLFDLAGDLIIRSHINNLEITLANNATIYLKGADRPDMLRGVSLKHCVLDEYAFMKPDVFENILRPALSDCKGTALFIGTPEGRNHFYDLYMGADDWDDWQSFHYTSFDNPILDPEEIEHARATLPAYSFQQEYMASFDANTKGVLDPAKLNYFEKTPTEGDYFIACDLAGFKSAGQRKSKKRDNTAIAIVFVTDDGQWYVEDIWFGQWSLEKTVEQIFRAAEKYRPMIVGIEKGIAQQAVMQPLLDLQRRTARIFRVHLLSHGNQRKEDRIAFSISSKLDHGLLYIREDSPYRDTLVDEMANFPSRLVHDDLIDALAYTHQLAKSCYLTGDEALDQWEPLDAVSGY